MGQRQNREPESKGPLMYTVETDDGALWRRHVDQTRATAPSESIPDESRV